MLGIAVPAVSCRLWHPCRLRWRVQWRQSWRCSVATTSDGSRRGKGGAPITMPPKVGRGRSRPLVDLAVSGAGAVKGSANALTPTKTGKNDTVVDVRGEKRDGPAKENVGTIFSNEPSGLRTI